MQQHRHQVSLDHVLAAPEIDHRGAPGQRGERPGVEDIVGFGRQRQQVDDDFGPREERGEAVRAMKIPDPRGILGRPGPSGDLESHVAQPFGTGPGDNAEAEEAHAPVTGERLVEPDPLGARLGGGAGWPTSVSMNHSASVDSGIANAKCCPHARLPPMWAIVSIPAASA